MIESPCCPLLGLLDDPNSRFSFPSVGHRCRASDRVRPIDLGHQSAFCLAAAYPDCPRYQAAAAAGRSGVAPGLGTLPARRRSRWLRGVAAVIAVAAVAAVVYLASPAIGDVMRRLSAGASAAASALPSGVLPVASVAPAPATTEPASASATPAATPAPTPTAAPIPSPAGSALVHVVVKGETLIGIAAKYGVTLAAIKSANAITDPSLIYVGERLVIPLR